MSDRSRVFNRIGFRAFQTKNLKGFRGFEVDLSAFMKFQRILTKNGVFSTWDAF